MKPAHWLAAHFHEIQAVLCILQATERSARRERVARPKQPNHMVQSPLNATFYTFTFESFGQAFRGVSNSGLWHRRGTLLHTCSNMCQAMHMHRG